MRLVEGLDGGFQRHLLQHLGGHAAVEAVQRLGSVRCPARCQGAGKNLVVRRFVCGDGVGPVEAVVENLAHGSPRWSPPRSDRVSASAEGDQATVTDDGTVG